MLVIGLTGGIGSGKTVIANMFAEYGVRIIDTDKIARELTQPNQPAFQHIIQHFGDHLLLPDGSLNRSALRDIIFSDTQQRIWLEKLLHPIILKEAEKQIKESTACYCIVVIPLLLEGEHCPFINRILVADAPEEIQIKRIESRDQLNRVQIQAILKTQARREERLAHAHDIILNDNGLTKLETQVAALHQQYLKMSQSIKK